MRSALGAPKRGTTTRFGQSGKAPWKRKQKPGEFGGDSLARTSQRREGCKGESPCLPEAPPGSLRVCQMVILTFGGG